MVEESAMYLALADSAIYMGQQSQKAPRQENAYALQHYTTSLGLIHEQLRDSASAVGNPIIGTVIGLASYDVRPPFSYCAPFRDLANIFPSYASTTSRDGLSIWLVSRE
jgi:hypothetical protein